MIKINSVGEAKRILIQIHPRDPYGDHKDRHNKMVKTINERFDFKVPDHKNKILQHIGVQG